MIGAMSYIHPSAIIAPGALIGARCHIGPFCVIGDNVELGDECWLHSHVVLDGHTRLGVGNQIYPFTSIGMRSQDLKWKGGQTWTLVGDNNTFRESVTIHSATYDGNATRVGSNNHILANCHIAHDVIVGSHIIMSNVATLGGHVVVEDHAVIGGLAAVHQFCRIGRMAIIGGCSKIVQDIPPFMLADGSPARTRTINKVGMDRNGISEETQVALKQVYRILFREGLSLPNALVRIQEEVQALPEVLHFIEFVKTSERGISK